MENCGSFKGFGFIYIYIDYNMARLQEYPCTTWNWKKRKKNSKRWHNKNALYYHTWTQLIQLMANIHLIVVFVVLSHS